MPLSPSLTRAAAAAALFGAGTAVAEAPKPHIVFFLADDYGWANMGVHRRGGDVSKQAQAETHTPTLDKLVDTGVLLDRHYAYKICSPSRSSLQSGRLALHVNAVNTGVTVVNASDPVSGAAGIPRNMTGVAQKLKQAGYSTHMVGKWDAGMATPDHTPWGKGYDSFVGYFQHANDYWRKTMPIQATGEIDNCLNSFVDLFMHNETYRGGVRDGPSMSPGCLADPSADPACYEEEIFKARALQVIKEHDVSKPLFLFYAFHLLHSPLQVHDSWLRKIDEHVASAGGDKFDTQNRRLYAAMALYMDEAIGQVIDALVEKGMYDNTLVVFSSDNGGPVYEPGSANNHPLKGGKYSDWEGGVRVNAFVSGGFVPMAKRGTKFSGIMSIADWYGTFCELAGVDQVDHAAAKANEWLSVRGLPLLPPVDSVPMWKNILDGSKGRGTLHLSSQAFLHWPFKLVVGKQTYSRWQGELFPNCTTIDGLTNDQGPGFQDLKIFDHKVPLGIGERAQDRLTWAEDCGEGCLFNVEEDPSEHVNLAQDAAHAKTFAALSAELANENAGLFNPGRGVVSIDACMHSISNGGYYGPFVEADDWYSPVPQRTPGEYQKDETLKKLIKLTNNDIVTKGVAMAAEAFTPLIRRPWFKTLDKCLTRPTEIVV